MKRIHDVDKLIQTGIDLMVARGYHHASINDVIKTAGLPKGSFYFIYPDKKSFALDVLDRYSINMLKRMSEAFEKEKNSPIEGIRTYFKASMKDLAKVGYSHGCFLGNMAQEMSDVDEDFRIRIEQTYSRLEKVLASQIEKAQEAGEINADRNAASVAQLIISSWHGSLTRMKATRSRKPLDNFINDMFFLLKL